MTSVLIFGFIIGLLATNGVPHFITGITGGKHQTALGRSTAATNVVWGWLNLAVAASLWHFIPIRQHPRAGFLAVILGVLVMGLILATTWDRTK